MSMLGSAQSSIPSRHSHLRSTAAHLRSGTLLCFFNGSIECFKHHSLTSSRYLNGSILIATLSPFTILHTLNTARGPSPITGLAWHGSSSKQKTEMLATQTSDGDLRVWSVSKPPATEPPRIIRILGTSEMSDSTRSWFGWSKNGRIVQYIDGLVFSTPPEPVYRCGSKKFSVRLEHGTYEPRKSRMSISPLSRVSQPSQITGPLQVCLRLGSII